MADILQPDKSSQTLNADIYWHYASDPVQRAQLLGTYNIGAPQKVLLPVPADADIVLRAVPRGARGQTWMAGPADADPVTVNVPGLGTGGGTSNYYQQLRVNHGYSYGTTPTPRPALNLLQSFQIKDDSTSGESDLSTFGVPNGMLNAKTDFNASGQINVTTGTITAGLNILTLPATLDLQPGMGVYVAGAGTSGPTGADLITTISAVSTDGKILTLNTNASATVSGAVVQADDTAAIQAWVNAKGDLWLPPGYYRLTSSIVLPTTSEGFSVIIHGSGWDETVLAWQHHGDGFIPTSDLKIDSFTLMDLTIATGTINDTAGTIDASSRGIGIRMTAPSYTGIYNNFVMQRCRVIGWGRWGMWSDNMEVSWVNECIFRENGSGHVAWVGPDQISPNKQPNANTLTNSTCDQGVGFSDSKSTITGSMSAGSRTLTGSGFSATDRGKFVIVHGAATSGSDLFTFIDVFNSSTSVTLAHQAQATSSGSVEIFQRNVASVLLNRANDTVVDGATIQGNFVGCSPSEDINAIKMYNSANCRFVGIHEEDNAGFGGSALRMENCQSVSIENWGGTSAEAGFTNAHRSDFALINCHSLRVAQSYFNDRPQFEIDSTSSEIEIDNSFVVGWINLWQQDASWDKLRVGSGVRIYQSADPRTNQSCGNEYIYDSEFGLDLIANGRFLDGLATGLVGLDGWTTTNPTWWSRTATSQTRYGTYIKSDSTAIADSGGTPATIFHQNVGIPDSLPPGGFTLAFDWYIESQAGSSSVSGRFTEVRLHPSSGIDEAMQWSVRPFTYVTGVWQTAQIKCWLGSGTSRNIDVQLNVTPGPNNVIIRFANFRLTPGKHSFGSYERAIHDFGGRMHAPLEYAPIAAVPTPPAVGSNLVSMINDGGVLKVSSNGSAYVAIGGALAGTQYHLPVFKTDGTLGDVGHLSEDYTVPRLTFNDVASANTNNAFYIRPQGNDNGIYIHPQATGYTGVAFAYQDFTNNSKFYVDGSGDLAFIKNQPYSWPTSLTYPPVSSGEMKVLAFTNTSGTPSLQWLTPPGSGTGTISAGTLNHVARYTTGGAGSTLGDSDIVADGTNIDAKAETFSITQKNSSLIEAQLKFNAYSGSFGIVRYEPRPNSAGGTINPANDTNGEIQFFLNGSSPSMGFGASAVTFGEPVGVHPVTGFTGASFEVDAPGATYTPVFRVKQDGDLQTIKNVNYSWPSANAAGFLTNNGSGTLVWSAASVGPGTEGTVAKFHVVGNAFGTTGVLAVADSGITENPMSGTTTISCNQVLFKQAQNVDIIDAFWRTGTTPTHTAFWRFEHRGSGAGADVTNTGGEMQLWLDGDTLPSIELGNWHSWFNNGIVMRPRTGYTDQAIVVYDVGTTNTKFGVALDGNLFTIRGQSYNWPTSPPAAGLKFLQIDPSTSNLSWVAAPSTLTGRTGYFPVFGASSGPLGDTSHFAEDTTNSRLTFNDTLGLNTNNAFYIRPSGNDNGIYVHPTATSSGNPFVYQDYLNGSKFYVSAAGDLTFIKNVAYVWPGSQGAAGTILTNNGSGGLSWAPSGASFTGRTGYFPVFGASSGPLGDTSHLVEDTTNIRLTFNDTIASNTNNAFYLKPNGNDNGIYIHPGASGYTGVPFVYQDFTNTSKFQVNAAGDLAYIKNVIYAWPSTQGANGAVLTNNGSGGLSWTVPAGAVMGRTGYFPVFASSGGPLQDLGHLVEDVTNIRLTFNDTIASNTNNTFYLKPNGNNNGIYIHPGASGYTGAPFVYQDFSNTSKFQVSSGGDLVFIKNVAYSWPAANASGVLTNNGSGTLTWTPASGSGANTALSNLTTTSINQSLLFGTDNSFDIGALAANRPRNFFASGGLELGSRIWQPGGGFGGSFTESISGTTLNNYHTIIADTVNGNMTLQLPAASTCNGRIWHLILLRRSGTGSTNTFTITCTGGDLINAAFTSISLSNTTSGQRDVMITADGQTGEWWVSAFAI